MSDETEVKPSKDNEMPAGDMPWGVLSRLRLNNLAAARSTYARIIRLRASKQIDRILYRDLVFGMNGLLAYFRTESEAAITERLAILEERLNRYENTRR